MPTLLEPKSEHERLWRQVRAILTGEEPALGVPDGAVPSLAEIYGILNPSRREYLAEQMVLVLSQIATGSDLSELQLNILALTYPYLTKSDHAANARTVVSRLFAREAWDSLSERQLDALAKSAVILAVELPTAVWLDFVKIRGDNAIGTALSPLARADLKSIQEIVSVIGLTPRLQEAIILLHPTLRRIYDRHEIKAALGSIMLSNEDTASTLRTFYTAEYGRLDGESGAVPILVSAPLAKITTDALSEVAHLGANRQLPFMAGKNAAIIYGAPPGSQQFLTLYSRLSEVADPTKMNVGVAVGEFLRGASSGLRQTVQQQFIDTDSAVAATSIIKKYNGVSVLLKELAGVVHKLNEKSVTYIGTLYHQDRAFMSLLEQLAFDQPDFRIQFNNVRWKDSGDSGYTLDKTDVCLRSKLIKTERAWDDIAERLVYEFKGYHVFANPGWLRDLHRNSRSSMPAPVREYLGALIESSLDVGAADRLAGDNALPSRAWLSLLGGVINNGGLGLKDALSVLTTAAQSLIGSKKKLPFKADFRRPNSDSVFEGLISGQMPAVIMGAIYGDLINTWWNRTVLRNRRDAQENWRLLLFAPIDFAKCVETAHGSDGAFVNVLRTGLEGTRQRYSNLYGGAWTNLMRALAALLAEVVEAPYMDGHQKHGLRAGDRDVLLNLLFLDLGAIDNWEMRSHHAPSMKWAFAAEQATIRRLFTYDDFSVALH